MAEEKGGASDGATRGAPRGGRGGAGEKGGASDGATRALPDWVAGVRRTFPELQDGLFLYRGDVRRKLSRFWILLALAAIIAAAGVLANSTATVIGAMIVAPLGTPIMGGALAGVIGDARRLWRSAALMLTDAAAVVLLGAFLAWVLPELQPLTSNGQ